jgi:hypothetical protein
MTETTTTDNATQVVNIINFHGLTLWVVAHDGTEYISAKALADFAGIDWRSAKKTIQEPDNAILYGTKWLKHPVFAAEGGTSTPTKEGLYIRLDRSRMYLARINTRMMRGKGSEAAAEQLLQLQIEWADVLHRYETDGVVYKKIASDNLNKLISLQKLRITTTDQREKSAVTRLIHKQLDALGEPVTKLDDDQLELNV